MSRSGSVLVQLACCLLPGSLRLCKWDWKSTYPYLLLHHSIAVVAVVWVLFCESVTQISSKHMIRCNNCTIWYHPCCVNLNSVQFSRLNNALTLSQSDNTSSLWTISSIFNVLVAYNFHLPCISIIPTPLWSIPEHDVRIFQIQKRIYRQLWVMYKLVTSWLQAWKVYLPMRIWVSRSYDLYFQKWLRCKNPLEFAETMTMWTPAKATYNISLLQ